MRSPTLRRAERRKSQDTTHHNSGKEGQGDKRGKRAEKPDMEDQKAGSEGKEPKTQTQKTGDLVDT